MRGVVDVIHEWFDSGGAAEYLGEPVTLRQHMLQTAAAAESDGAPVELVAAALLHDFGHLIHGKDSAKDGIDIGHEEIGFNFLQRHFPPSVLDPIRLHVAAKRYLCTIEPEYIHALSAASCLSYELQGGPMSAEEVADFESEPYFESACRLRRYDDAAKDPEADTPSLDHYLLVLEAVMD